MTTFSLLAVAVLLTLAIGDLVVGVANDAVNFLNSAIGSRAGSRRLIVTVASVGVILGALFSDGIIEVARKGIFDPSAFSSHEALLLFTAVALADIILLDLYSTFGLPTSTTVAVVFELLGGALTLAWWKTGSSAAAWGVINSASALRIITGILLSILVSFVAGLVVQYITRILFTFSIERKMRWWGVLWSGIALTALLFFVILKGGEHATFMAGAKAWVATHTMTMLAWTFVVATAVSALLVRMRVNLLRVIVLIGTGALALAFAGNDMANFIGVSVAGVHAFLGENLGAKLPTSNWVLLGAGAVMSATMFLSRKARTVTETEVMLASDAKHVREKWRDHAVARGLSSGFAALFGWCARAVPERTRSWIASRFERRSVADDAPAYDLLRAAVNVMLAAAIISYATSQKLPLSTTYVTFTVAMGTALADRAWSKECAPHRIAGVLSVVGGWFITAILGMAFAAVTVSTLHVGGTTGLVLLIVLDGFLLTRLHGVHKHRTRGGLRYA